VMLISDAGTVIRIPVDDIRRAGRATQGVIVMRPREGEKVATLASVMSSDDASLEPVGELGEPAQPV
jgi:DNA gyrase subunit A